MVCTAESEIVICYPSRKLRNYLNSLWIIWRFYYTVAKGPWVVLCMSLCDIFSGKLALYSYEAQNITHQEIDTGLSTSRDRSQENTKSDKEIPVQHWSLIIISLISLIWGKFCILFPKLLLACFYKVYPLINMIIWLRPCISWKEENSTEYLKILKDSIFLYVFHIVTNNCFSLLKILN